MRRTVIRCVFEEIRFPLAYELFLIENFVKAFSLSFLVNQSRQEPSHHRLGMGGTNVPRADK